MSKRTEALIYVIEKLAEPPEMRLNLVGAVLATVSTAPPGWHGVTASVVAIQQASAAWGYEVGVPGLSCQGDDDNRNTQARCLDRHLSLRCAATAADRPEIKAGAAPPRAMT